MMRIWCGCTGEHIAQTEDGKTLCGEELEWAHDTLRKMPGPNMLDHPMMTERLSVVLDWSLRTWDD